MKIGNKEVKEILIMTDDNELIASITDEDVIEEDGCKVELDSVDRGEKEAVLTNCISQCMICNNMTLENLDDACEQIREVYRKNAVVVQSESE